MNPYDYGLTAQTICQERNREVERAWQWALAAEAQHSPQVRRSPRQVVSRLLGSLKPQVRLGPRVVRRAAQ